MPLNKINKRADPAGTMQPMPTAIIWTTEPGRGTAGAARVSVGSAATQEHAKTGPATMRPQT